MTRLLLVDDQPLVRAGLRMILKADPAMEIAGECDDGDQVAEAVTRLKPDIVMMDIRMRRMNGDVATRHLRLRADTPPVLILTTFEDEPTVAAALHAGAAGFILKDAAGEEIIDAVRTVASGGAWLDPRIAPQILATYRASAPAAAPNDRLESLTPRERDVLRQLATGATNAEIADALFISEPTVKTHLGNILAKLDLRDRASAIIFALTGDRPPVP